MKIKPWPIRIVFTLVGFLVVLVSIPLTVVLIEQAKKPLTKAQAATTSFLETFEVSPSTPLFVGGVAGKNILPNWDIQVHSRDSSTWDQLEFQDNVMHGADCAAPPAMHTNNTYEGAIFLCKNHIMTAMTAGGYGLIMMTPNHMVDFSSGVGVVQFEMSTSRQSTRDWPDVWISPFADATALPFNAGDVDLQGIPKNSVHISLLNNQSTWVTSIIRNFAETGLNSVYDTNSIHVGIAPGTNQDATRQTFRLSLTRTHIKLERLVSPTATAAVYLDRDVPDIGFSQGVVQFGHHIYFPTKDGSGVPATWHWDNVSINPSVPFTIIHADKRSIGTGEAVNFDKPAPVGSYLRFSAIGRVEYSLNNGSTWQVASKQLFVSHPEHHSPYLVPVPTGTQKVNFRFSTDNWYGCNHGCQAKDFSIFSLTTTTDPPTGKVGDLNNDNLVNILDLSILLSKFNTTDTAADLNQDGKVDLLDLSVLLSKWGS